MDSYSRRAAALQSARVKTSNRELRAWEEHDNEEGHEEKGQEEGEDLSDEKTAT